MTHRVAVLALDGVFPFDLGIPARIFAEAHDTDGRPLYEVRTCSVDGRTVRTNAGFSIAVEHDLSLLDTADTVVVATQEPGADLLANGILDPVVRQALARIPAHARIVSLCTSAFLLAAAGLLDDHEATTHWALTDDLARLFPRVAVRPDVLFVDNGRVLTSAGGAAGIDLCLHLVRRDFGAHVANGAARRCVVAPWRDGGQAQFIDHPAAPADAGSTAATRDWALAHLDRPLSLAQLAAHAHMTVRTFTRRFHAEVGTSAAQWLTARRVERARALLESTNLAIDQIAREAGFASTTLLRHHLRASVGLSPSEYRRTFAARVPTGSDEHRAVA